MRASRRKASPMRGAILRLLSMAYILLVSVLIAIISAFAWMTLSKNPALNTMGFGISIPGPDIVYEVWDGSYANIADIEVDENGAFIIRTPAEFAAVMELSTDYHKYGIQNITMIIANHLDMAGLEWIPTKIDSYDGFQTITIYGDEHCMKGFTAPMFEGGFGGSSGIIIHDVTIVDSNIVSKNTTGSGAFIEVVDSVSTVEMKNCHFVRSTLTGSRTGGLIGYTAGYNNTNDGAVRSYVSIVDCSVDNCQITGNGTVGGIIGQAGANAWTFQTLENCEVNNTKLVSTASSNKGIGTMIGTANVGEITFIDCKSIGVVEQGADTVTDTIYGRLALGTTGKIVDIHDATAYVWGGFIQSAADKLTRDNQIWLINDTVTLSNEIRFQGNNILISGLGQNSTINFNSVATGYVWQGQKNSSSGFNFGALGEYTNDIKEGTTIQFSNLKLDNNKTLDGCTSSANRSTSYIYAYAENVSYTNCVLTGGVVTYGNTIIDRCSVTESDSNMYCVFLDNQYGGNKNNYIITNSTFDSMNSAYGCIKVADDKSEGAILTITSSEFNNVVNKAAVYVNGTTAVTASNNVFNNCVVGEIIAKGNNCTLNGEACPTA